MRSLFFVSWRYLKAHQCKLFFTPATWISILGVALGVCALIVVISVMDGLQTELKKSILKTSSHIQITGIGNKIHNLDDTIKIIRAIDGVVGVAPRISDAFLLKTEYNRTFPVEVTGISPLDEENVSKLSECVLSHRIEFPDTFQILVGGELARIFGIDKCDTVWLISSQMDMTVFGLYPRMIQVSVYDYFKTGFYETDLRTVYAPIDLLRKVLEYSPNESTSIAVETDEPYHADRISNLIHKQLSKRGIFFVQTWQDMRQNLFEALKHENAAMFIIISLVIIVAAMNIIGSLIMRVLEKKKEIGILRSLGVTTKSILWIFVQMGMIIGIAGVTSGMSVGILICYIIKHYKIPLPGGGAIYYIDKLPVHVDIFYIIIIPLVALLITLLSAIYPALKASKLNPVEALRNE